MISSNNNFIRRFLSGVVAIFSLLLPSYSPVTAQSPVRFADAPSYKSGLDGRNIALWPSHGLYYNQEKENWMWQRAHLLQTIEDLYTASYVYDLLAPMLENAGAYVLMPRERDLSRHEIIIDADSESTPGYSETDGAERWRDADMLGFRMPLSSLGDRENPFTEGSLRVVSATTDESRVSTAQWIADIPETGVYTIYISYASLPESAGKVVYTVNSMRGEERFFVNQKMGGGTWIRLGEFPLAKGRQVLPVVSVSNLIESSKDGSLITADAVKIGGGMGNVARSQSPDFQRNGKSKKSVDPKNYSGVTGRKSKACSSTNAGASLSGRPRWMEGARYWLQWAGIPDSIYSPTDYTNDYVDDYSSRPRWVNYMAGGSEKLPGYKGLNIPIDLSLALHTDAGTTPDSTIVGTLGIYCTDDGNRLGDGRKRTTCRLLTESVVNQIGSDMRALHDPIWKLRKIRDKKYAEARIPMVPSTLIELLSHQNFADMKHGHNPQFRFDVSRSIYKGVLKYLAGEYGYDYVVQPLPVSDFAIVNRGGGVYRLSWSPTADRLEPTATPRRYIVEMRRDGEVFKPVAKVSSTSYDVDCDEGVVYSFRIIAENDGGVSFPSESLSLCRLDNGNPAVLVINGFTRLSSPEWTESEDQACFLDSVDYGVPYLRNIAYTGSQYNYDRSAPWRDDIIDPGFGASNCDYEGQPISGNSFDYPYLHGKSIARSGYPFVSVSLSGYLSNPGRYRETMIDLILGKQKETRQGSGSAPTKFKCFPGNLQDALKKHCAKGGSLLVSGEFVGTDIFCNPFSDEDTALRDADFATETLGIEQDDQFAASSGAIRVLPFWANLYLGSDIEFASMPNESVYAAGSPDALAVADRGVSCPIMLYGDSGRSAAIASRCNGSSVITMGFPFETILAEADRDNLMQQLMEFLRTTKHPVSDPVPQQRHPRIESIIPIPDTNPYPLKIEIIEYEQQNI